MPWIAMKEQKVKRDGRYVVVKPGDEIPEAEFWGNRNVWIRQKFIKWMERTESPNKVDVVIAEEKDEEKKAAEKKAAEEKLAEEKLAEKKAAEEKAAEEKLAEEKAVKSTKGKTPKSKTKAKKKNRR